mgnify:CR=1 FL=1
MEVGLRDQEQTAGLFCTDASDAGDMYIAVHAEAIFAINRINAGSENSSSKRSIIIFLFTRINENAKWFKKIKRWCVTRRRFFFMMRCACVY